MLCGFDTRDTSAVEREITDGFRTLFPNAPVEGLRKAFQLAEDSFQGCLPGYEANDAAYHDWEHTLQATICLHWLLKARQIHRMSPALTPRAYEMALWSGLFHDSGYLRTHREKGSTGALFTRVHVQRSESFIGALLPKQGFNAAEVAAMQRMIRCTQINQDLSLIAFESELEKQLGCALATGDLLGQMAADDYVDKLPALFEEIRESYKFQPPDKAPSSVEFRSAEELIRSTPSFWENYVVPKLNSDFGRAYQFLNVPYPDGPNPFLKAVEQNLRRIRKP